VKKQQHKNATMHRADNGSYRRNYCAGSALLFSDFKKMFFVCGLKNHTKYVREVL
jgi:hypothetical protein